MSGIKKKIPWKKILRTAARVAVALLAAAGVFLLSRILINKAFLFDYRMEKYSELPEALLIPIELGEDYVAPYNVGNVKYRKGDYEAAAQLYYAALRKEHPEEKDCLIRINLALSLLHDYPFDTMDTADPEQVEKALEVLYSARYFLTENGCASVESDSSDGHSADAEKLKRDIDEMIRALESSPAGACSDPSPDDKGGKSDPSDGDQKNDPRQDREESGKEREEEEKKQQSLQQQLRDQKKDLEQGTFSGGGDHFVYIEGSGELVGYGEGTPW